MIFLLAIVGIAVAVGAALVYNALRGARDDANEFSKSKAAGDPVQRCPLQFSKSHPKILNQPAAERATKKYAGLSPDEKKKFDAAMEKATSDEERAYIMKAFAACHTPDECSAFGDKIRGKDATWMQDNLQLTGSSTGKGVQQQWSHSCNATTAEAVRGQIDPVYALQVHEENPNFYAIDGADAMKQNPRLATEQRDMLTSEYSGSAAGKHSGIAAARDAAGGQGRWGSDLLNQQTDATGIAYTTVKDPALPVEAIDKGLATGAPVPIVIGNGPGEYTHYVLVTGSDAGPPKKYTLHDPWEGKTVDRTEDDIKNGHIDLAGSNQVTAIESPNAVPLKAAGKPAC